MQSPRLLQIPSRDSLEQVQALASEMRLSLLGLLARHEHNVNELAIALKVSQPTVSRHVQVLERAGLIECNYRPGVQGMQKVCRLRYERLTLLFEPEDSSQTRIETVDMPIGLYTSVAPVPTCGLAGTSQIIGFFDMPQTFFSPGRLDAQLLWMSAGHIEYVFPCLLPTTALIQRLEFSMEICSESPGFNEDYPSDITLWINNVEIGTWTSPGDFGKERGLLNPSWWSEVNTQHGLLKVWSVGAEGSFIDGTFLSAVNLNDILIQPQQPIILRIGVKEDAEHRGGFNLFGRGFGNYGQDIVMRLHYTGLRERREAELSEAAAV